MPKKFANENSKAVAARERKKNAKDAEDAKKQKEKDEAYWREDDKQALKKQQKKEEQERKRQQQLERKAENKALLEQEQQNVKSATKTSGAGPTSKVTRAQIDAIKAAAMKTAATVVTDKKIDTQLEAPLEENINRMKIDGEEARNVDEAISILSSKPGEIDKHPEKRMKAAYTAFEAKRLPELKMENPSLKLSQLKQMVFKEWQKSPENPLNQL